MPTYVYQCSTCEKIFEAEQRITADPLKDCDCGAKNSLKRLIQPIAVMFKGSGFHINDYASSTATTKPVEATAPASGESKSSETESKPSETKTESPAASPAPSAAPSAPPASSSTENKA
jgi:putative FmdB family regulatory protein